MGSPLTIPQALATPVVQYITPPQQLAQQADQLQAIQAETALRQQQTQQLQIQNQIAQEDQLASKKINGIYAKFLQQQQAQAGQAQPQQPTQTANLVPTPDASSVPGSPPLQPGAPSTPGVPDAGTQAMPFSGGGMGGLGGGGDLSAASAGAPLPSTQTPVGGASAGGTAPQIPLQSTPPATFKTTVTAPNPTPVPAQPSGLAGVMNLKDQMLNEIVHDPDIPARIKDAEVQQAIDFHHKMAQATELDLKNMATKNGQVAVMLSSVLAKPESDQPAAYQQTLSQIKAMGADTSTLPPTWTNAQDIASAKMKYQTVSEVQNDAKDFDKNTKDAATTFSQTVVPLLKNAPDDATRQQILADARNQAPWYIHRMIPKAYAGASTIDTISSLGQSPEQQEESPGKLAQASQNIRANDASILASAKTKDQYAALYNTIAPARLAGFPTPDQWDPKESPTDILHLGENPTQRLTREHAAIEAKIAQQRADEQSRRNDSYQHHIDALDSKIAAGQSGALKEGTYWNLYKQHNDLEQKKDDQWAQNIALGDIVDRSKVGDKAIDPITKKEVELTPQNMAYYKSLQGRTQAKALAYENAMKGIEQRLHGGEFADVEQNLQGQGTSLPSAGPTPTQAPGQGGATTPAKNPVQKTQPQSATPKPFPSTRLHEYAAANNWTDDQAKQYLTSNGYVLK